MRFHTNEQIYKNLWFQQFQLELISHYLEVQKFPQKQSTFTSNDMQFSYNIYIWKEEKKHHSSSSTFNLRVLYMHKVINEKIPETIKI